MFSYLTNKQLEDKWGQATIRPTVEVKINGRELRDILKSYILSLMLEQLREADKKAAPNWAGGATLTEEGVCLILLEWDRPYQETGAITIPYPCEEIKKLYDAYRAIPVAEEKLYKEPAGAFF